MAKSRAKLSSQFAALAALAVALFTVGVASNLTISAADWSIWIVIGWSLLLAAALFVWSRRKDEDSHLLGNPTLSMVAGASGSAIAAVALAFAFASDKDQTPRAKEQVQLLREQNLLLKEQLQSIQALASDMRDIRRSLSLGPNGSASAPVKR